MTTTDENPNMVDWTERNAWFADSGTVTGSCSHLTSECYREAIRNGHYNDPETGEPIRYTVAELLTLVVEELTEAVFANLDGSMDKHLPHRLEVEVEIADALIILFGACGHLGLDIGNAMAEKLEYNRTRKGNAEKRRAAT